MENSHKVKQLAENYTANAAGPFALFSRRQHEVKALAALGHEDYYTAYIGLYRFAFVLAFGAQLASVASEYGYFEAILAVKLTAWPLTLATAATVGTLELAKYFVFNRVFKDLFRLAGPRVPAGLALIALALSALSVYASIQGGGQLAVNPQTVQVAAQPYDQEINTLREEIKAVAARNTNKTGTWIPKADKKAIATKEAMLEKAIAAKEAAQSKALENEAANVQAYQYGFGAFEAVFVLCTLFVWYFTKRTAVEGEVQAAPVPLAKPQAQTERQSSQQYQHPSQQTAAFEPPQTARPIGFTYGNQSEHNENRITKIVNENRLSEGTRLCKHCGTAYQHKHHKQLYCSDECRITAWETKNKRPVRKGKKQLDLF